MEVCLPLWELIRSIESESVVEARLTVDGLLLCVQVGGLGGVPFEWLYPASWVSQAEASLLAGSWQW